MLLLVHALYALEPVVLTQLSIFEHEDVEFTTSKFAFALQACAAHDVPRMEPLCTTGFAHEFSLVASMIHPLSLCPVCVLVPNLALAASQV